MINKKKIGLAASLIMLLSSVKVEAGPIIDMPNDWSRTALENGIKNGLFQGTEKGRINPNNTLTKAEMATIVNRILALDKKANLNKYKDMSKDKWYYKEIAKSVEAGLIAGEANRINPEEAVAREEAFTIIARAMNLKSKNGYGKNFDDAHEISYWASDRIAGLAESGYISGYKGRINPKARITRAEFAKVLDNIFKEYISEAGTYTEVAGGNVVVNSPNVELQNLMVAGDLIITEGASRGRIELTNVGVTNRIVVRGGSRIVLRNGSNANTILVDNKVTDPDIEIETGSSVDFIELNSPTTIDGGGKVRDIVARDGSDYSRIYVENTNIDIESKAKNIKDRSGRIIRSGLDMVINKDAKRIHTEAVDDFRDLRYKARALNDKKINKTLEKLELIGKDSSIGELENAIKDLDREIAELEREEARRQEYYNELEDLREEARKVNFDELGPALSKYAAVDIRSDIRLIIDAIEELGETLDRGKSILKEKSREYSKLQELRKRAEEINNQELTSLVGRYNHLTESSTVEDLKAAIKSIEEDFDRIEEELEIKRHKDAFERVQLLIKEAEKSIERSSDRKIEKVKEEIKIKKETIENLKKENKAEENKEQIEKTEKEIKAIDDEIKELEEKIKKLEEEKTKQVKEIKEKYGELTLESKKADLDKAITEIEAIIKKADKGLEEQIKAFKELEVFRKEAKETKREAYKEKVKNYDSLTKDSMIFELEKSVEDIDKFKNDEFSEVKRALEGSKEVIKTAIEERLKEEDAGFTDKYKVEEFVEDKLLGYVKNLGRPNYEILLSEEKDDEDETLVIIRLKRDIIEIEIDRIKLVKKEEAK